MLTLLYLSLGHCVLAHSLNEVQRSSIAAILMLQTNCRTSYFHFFGIEINQLSVTGGYWFYLFQEKIFAAFYWYC